VCYTGLSSSEYRDQRISVDQDIRYYNDVSDEELLRLLEESL
jgi:hypothetical protein